MSHLRPKTTRQLLSLFSEILEELRERGAVRTGNNPVADYAESLVAKTLSLRLLPRSTTGYDAEGADGKRDEIKCRRTTRHNASTQLSVLRGLEKTHFDFLICVLFDEDFEVRRGCVVPHDAVLRLTTYRKHVNGWILLLRPQVWEVPGVIDITDKLRRAARES